MSVSGALLRLSFELFTFKARFSKPEGSMTSNLTRCGAISAILVLISSKESYGRGVLRYSDKALRIYQSSLANPGGDCAALDYWGLPSVFTNMADFSRYEAPGKIKSA